MNMSNYVNWDSLPIESQRLYTRETLEAEYELSGAIASAKVNYRSDVRSLKSRRDDKIRLAEAEHRMAIMHIELAKLGELAQIKYTLDHPTE